MQSNIIHLKAEFPNKSWPKKKKKKKEESFFCLFEQKI